MIFSLLTFSPIIIKIQMANSFVYLAYYLSHSFVILKKNKKKHLYNVPKAMFSFVPLHLLVKIVLEI